MCVEIKLFSQTIKLAQDFVRRKLRLFNTRKELNSQIVHTIFSDRQLRYNHTHTESPTLTYWV